MRWADRIVTVSETARRDLLAWFRLPDDRVRVVPEGPRRRLRAGAAGAGVRRCVLARVRHRARRVGSCSTSAA